MHKEQTGQHPVTRLPAVQRHPARRTRCHPEASVQPIAGWIQRSSSAFDAAAPFTPAVDQGGRGMLSLPGSNASGRAQPRRRSNPTRPNTAAVDLYVPHALRKPPAWPRTPLAPEKAIRIASGPWQSHQVKQRRRSPPVPCPAPDHAPKSRPLSGCDTRVTPRRACTGSPAWWFVAAALVLRPLPGDSTGPDGSLQFGKAFKISGSGPTETTGRRPTLRSQQSLPDPPPLRWAADRCLGPLAHRLGSNCRNR